MTGDTPVFSANLTVTSFSSYGGQTNIVRQATGNITFTGGSLSLPVSASPSQLVVQAGNNIIVDDGTGMVAGLLSLCFGDADGGMPAAQDISSFIIQTSTNLVDWTTVYPTITTNAAGGLLFQVPLRSDSGGNFHRILSQ